MKHVLQKNVPIEQRIYILHISTICNTLKIVQCA